jgi:hypothetical protein
VQRRADLARRFAGVLRTAGERKGVYMATTYRLLAVDNPQAPFLEVSTRLRAQLVYFMTPPDEPHVPPLAAQDYWIDAEHTAQWLEAGVIEVVSPLDEAHHAVVELSEEQEIFLEWLAAYHVQHIRVQSTP